MQYFKTPDGSVHVLDDGVAPGNVPRFPGNATQMTAPEVDAYLNSPPATPTKDQRIAEVLATLGKGKDRTLIQQVIAFGEIVAAPMLATQYGVSLEFALMGLYARNKTYRESKDAELACQAIEEEP